MKNSEKQATAKSEENGKTSLTIVAQETANGKPTLTGEPPITPEDQSKTHNPDARIPLEKRRETVEGMHHKIQLLDRYKQRLQDLKSFEFDLKQDADISNSEVETFGSCAIRVTDSQGRSYTAKSPSFIFETHEMLKAKYVEAIEKLDSEIVWPYRQAS